MCMYTNRHHMACVPSMASNHFLILLGKALPPEPKNSCWLLLWLVGDHTHTGNNIQKDVHTFMKQSYHVPIIRIVQQINEEMILCLRNYCQSSCAKIIKLTQHKHGVDLQLQLQKKTVAIHMTVMLIRILIHTTVVPIRILIRTTAIISALS